MNDPEGIRIISISDQQKFDDFMSGKEVRVTLLLTSQNEQLSPAYPLVVYFRGVNGENAERGLVRAIDIVRTGPHAIEPTLGHVLIARQPNQPLG